MTRSTKSKPKADAGLEPQAGEATFPPMTPETWRVVEAAPSLAAQIAHKIVDLREGHPEDPLKSVLALPAGRSRTLYLLGWRKVYEADRFLMQLLTELLGEQDGASRMTMRHHDRVANALTEDAEFAEKLMGLDRQAALATTNDEPACYAIRICCGPGLRRGRG